MRRLWLASVCLAKTVFKKPKADGCSAAIYMLDLTLHLIGPLQTNKAADAVALFDVIEVVDRPKLAKALGDEMIRQNRQLECYIQVNTGKEAQKSGIAPEDADDFIAYCRDEAGLNITGLMCIPPIDEEAAMHFALCKSLPNAIIFPSYQWE